MRNYSRDSSVFGAIYLIVGLFVAYSHGYLAGITTIAALFSALLAVIAWPLLFFGIDLHLTM
jgi:hypothetical protein